MSNISVQELIGKGYGSGWFTNCKARYRVFEGGRGTKKSVNIAGYEPIFKLICDSNRNVVMCRQDDTNNATSTFANIVQLINGLGLAELFKVTTSPREIIYRPTGQKIIFKGCNNPTAITSTKFISGELTDIYLEEASEIDSYDTFRKIDGSVRSQFGELQITMLLNGWDKKSWIYDIFFKGRLEDDYDYLETHDYQDYYDKDFNIGYGSGLYLHKSTFRINEFRAAYKDESMAILKKNALEIYKVEGLGMWGNTSAATYTYWNDDLILPHYKAALMNFCAYTIGIDIGAGNGEGKPVKNTKDNPDRVKSAMTMSLNALTADYETIVPLDEYFYSNQNQTIKKGSVDIAEDMINKIIQWIDIYKPVPVVMKGTIIVYVESADPGGFRSLLEAKAREHGIINIRFIASTKNKIQTRVDFTNLLMAFGNFRPTDKCQNLIREIKNARADESGRCREDIDDHMLNAHEYAVVPLYPKIKRWASFKEH